MNKIYIIFVFIAISFSSFSKEIIAKWNFHSITSDSSKISKNIKVISNGDAMYINKDGSFNYEIKSENLKATGTWNVSENLLTFSYRLPKIEIRYFNINFEENKLFLNEKEITYTFKKEVISNTLLPTTGLTVNSVLRGILGILSLLLLAFILSRNRSRINWTLVVKGLGIQFLFAILILKVPIVYSIFTFLAKIFTKIIAFTNKGSEFLFGGLMNASDSFGYIFAFQVLPTVIFFSALTSLFYYWKILPKVVYIFAWLMKKTLKLSGPESVAAAGNIFLGQTESPLLVKPYLDKMTKSEILCLMSGGMATIAGGVLAAFIGMLGEEFAIHLIMASVMSAPAAVVAAKILLPEKEKFNSSLKVNIENSVSNELEAISQGTTDGIRLAVNVGAMLLVFTSLMYMVNYILFKFGIWTDINEWITENTRYSKLSLNMILGYLGAPIVWLMGVCREDMFLVGELLGEKTVLNEFVGYMSLGEMKAAGLFVEQKSIIIATYILCGFANFASIGIQIGGIGALAPKRRGDLSNLGVLALIAGTLASLFTAVIVGMII
jgi:CNT family concentrative nucleoside transporter